MDPLKDLDDNFLKDTAQVTFDLFNECHLYSWNFLYYYNQNAIQLYWEDGWVKEAIARHN